MFLRLPSAQPKQKVAEAKTVIVQKFTSKGFWDELQAAPQKAFLAWGGSTPFRKMFGYIHALDADKEKLSSFDPSRDAAIDCITEWIGQNEEEALMQCVSCQMW